MLFKLGLKLWLLQINCWLSNTLKSFRQFPPTYHPLTNSGFTMMWRIWNEMKMPFCLIAKTLLLMMVLVSMRDRGSLRKSDVYITFLFSYCFSCVPNNKRVKSKWFKWKYEETEEEEESTADLCKLWTRTRTGKRNSMLDRVLKWFPSSSTSLGVWDKASALWTIPSKSEYESDFIIIYSVDSTVEFKVARLFGNLIFLFLVWVLVCLLSWKWNAFGGGKLSLYHDSNGTTFFDYKFSFICSNNYAICFGSLLLRIGEYWGSLAFLSSQFRIDFAL